tara:strand:+ start:318 stop:725 length:408 start_codon:yes stop_codon:yes gene_type:complete
MIDSKTQIRRLVESLYIRTLEGKISWSYDASSDSCECEVGEGYIQILQESDDNGDYYTFIRVLNNQKQVIENIYGGSVGSNTKPFNTPHKDYWELMVDLRAMAQRSAIGGDAVLASMLAQLNADKIAMEEDEIPF